MPSFISPSAFRPVSFADLIGPAAAIGHIMQAKVARYKAARSGNAKLLFYGPPGTGKSALAHLTALALAEDKIAIEEVSGLALNVELVKRWINSACLGGLFGDWQVKVVHELDRVPRDAQDMLLQYLDILPAKTAFIGTSNLQMELLQERFQTRMQAWKVVGPTQEEIAGLLRRWDLPKTVLQTIAFGSGGCVRAALLDAESQLDVQLAA